MNKKNLTLKTKSNENIIKMKRIKKRKNIGLVSYNKLLMNSWLLAFPTIASGKYTKFANQLQTRDARINQLAVDY